MSMEPDRNFHVVIFSRPVEAAAFVAALSRFLNSPQAGPVGRAPEAVEVWHGSTERTDRVALYLSDEALRLANDAFPAAPVSGVIRFDALPANRTIVLKGGQTAAMGMVDAQDLLSARQRQTPLGMTSFRTPGP
jgi:hypothetical protein